jgi:hypothetical protein
VLALNENGHGLALARRSAIVIVAAIAIYLAGGKSLAYLLRFTSPETALRYDPGNADALAARAEQALLGNEKHSKKIATEYASAALRKDASSASAAATLGILKSAAGETELAARQFDYTQKLSRRNLPAQLWFIDRAVAANDVPNALHHYDIALRTSSLAPPILFPILKSALADPQFVAPVARVLARRPNWAPVFVRELADSGPNMSNIAALFETLRRSNTPVGNYEVVTLQQRLSDAGDYESAWALYAGQHPNANRGAIRDRSFRSVASDASIFEWQLNAASTTGAITVSNPDGLRLRFEASDRSGIIVSQTMLLSAGDYQLEGAVSDYDPPARTSAEMRVVCITQNAAIARIMLPASATKFQKFKVAFTVSNACRVQRLQLYVDSAGATLLSGAIGDLVLKSTTLSAVR